ncbi:MAG: glycosyltransferase [Candidatus Micrarchaeaceae archaeon]
MLVNDALIYSGINIYSKWIFKSGFHKELYNFSYSDFAKKHYYLNILKYSLGLKNIIKNSDEKIIHYTSIMPISKNKDIKQFMTVHDLFYHKYYFSNQNYLDHSTIKNLYDYLIVRAKMKGVYFITGSNYIKRQLKHYFNIDADVVYEFMDNLIKEYRYQNVLNRKENKIYILNISDCNTRKNINFRNEIEWLFDNFIFVNIGCEYNNDNVLNFKGLSNDEYYSIFKDIDYVFLPSVDEGFGIPFYEAMFFKKPIIAFKLDVYEELYSELQYAKTGYDIIYMLKNLDQLNNNYIDIYQKNYTYEREYEKLKRIYQE